MTSGTTTKRKNLSYRILSCFIAVTFIFNVVLPPGYAQLIPQALLELPAPGTMVNPSPGFAPAIIKGITIHPDNPLQFDFIIDTGHTQFKDQELRKESSKLIKYFLAALTVPEKEMWVNLSPYEKDRIVPQGFGTTEMGRDLLAQDYILKQLTASLMYPEKELGKKFWDKVYKQAKEKYGTTEIPMDTFNKVWIVPEQAVVYENGSSAFVVKSHLKVMLEEDYLAASHQSSDVSHQKENKNLTTDDRRLTTQVIREVIVPELEKEVNEGKTFANLRQIYNSVILAAWYKMNLRESLLGKVYVDQNKTKGVDTQDKTINQKIYEQYLEAFKRGVYNYIKEDVDPATQEVIPRKYFSGGLDLNLSEAAGQETSLRSKSVFSVLRKVVNAILPVLAAGVISTMTPDNLRAMVNEGVTPQGRYVSVGANVTEVGKDTDQKYLRELTQQVTDGDRIFNPALAQAAEPRDDPQAMSQAFREGKLNGDLQGLMRYISLAKDLQEQKEIILKIAVTVSDPQESFEALVQISNLTDVSGKRLPIASFVLEELFADRLLAGDQLIASRKDILQQLTQHPDEAVRTKAQASLKAAEFKVLAGQAGMITLFGILIFMLGTDSFRNLRELRMLDKALKDDSHSNLSKPSSSPLTQERAREQLGEFLKSPKSYIFKAVLSIGGAVKEDRWDEAEQVSIELLQELYGQRPGYQIFDTHFQKKDITTQYDVDFNQIFSDNEVAILSKIVLERITGVTSRPFGSSSSPASSPATAAGSGVAQDFPEFFIKLQEGGISRVSIGQRKDGQQVGIVYISDLDLYRRERMHNYFSQERGRDLTRKREGIAEAAAWLFDLDLGNFYDANNLAAIAVGRRPLPQAFENAIWEEELTPLDEQAVGPVDEELLDFLINDFAVSQPKDGQAPLNVIEILIQKKLAQGEHVHLSYQDGGLGLSYNVRGIQLAIRQGASDVEILKELRDQVKAIGGEKDVRSVANYLRMLEMRDWNVAQWKKFWEGEIQDIFNRIDQGSPNKSLGVFGDMLDSFQDERVLNGAIAASVQATNNLFLEEQRSLAETKLLPEQKKSAEEKISSKKRAIEQIRKAAMKKRQVLIEAKKFASSPVTIQKIRDTVQELMKQETLPARWKAAVSNWDYVPEGAFDLTEKEALLAKAIHVNVATDPAVTEKRNLSFVVTSAQIFAEEWRGDDQSPLADSHPRELFRRDIEQTSLKDIEQVVLGFLNGIQQEIEIQTTSEKAVRYLFKKGLVKVERSPSAEDGKTAVKIYANNELIKESSIWTSWLPQADTGVFQRDFFAIFNDVGLRRTIEILPWGSTGEKPVSVFPLDDAAYKEFQATTASSSPMVEQAQREVLADMTELRKFLQANGGAFYPDQTRMEPEQKLVLIGYLDVFAKITRDLLFYGENLSDKSKFAQAVYLNTALDLVIEKIDSLNAQIPQGSLFFGDRKQQDLSAQKLKKLRIDFEEYKKASAREWPFYFTFPMVARRFGTRMFTVTRDSNREYRELVDAQKGILTELMKLRDSLEIMRNNFINLDEEVQGVYFDLLSKINEFLMEPLALNPAEGKEVVDQAMLFYRKASSVQDNLGFAETYIRDDAGKTVEQVLLEGQRRLSGNIVAFQKAATQHWPGRGYFDIIPPTVEGDSAFGTELGGGASSPMIEQGAEPVGGIDLNPALLDLQIRRDANFVPLPLPQQPIGEMHIDGFIPVIINIVPVTNLPLLLGIADEGKPSDAADSGTQPMELGFAIKED